MNLAVVFSSRATCLRLKVGCVIAKSNMLMSEGYNGSVSGLEHCIDVGCLKNEQGRCIRCLHAEQNAIINASNKGVNIRGGTAYITHEPCETCSKVLRQSGIIRIVYLVEYKNEYNKHFLEGLDVSLFNGRNRERLLKKLELDE